MQTLVYESPRTGSIFLTNRANVVRRQGDVSTDLASSVSNWNIEDSSPYVKWISGSYVESENPNQNNQFWTTEDIEFGQYSITYSPLNVVHKVRQPVGFFLATKKVDLKREQASSTPVRIEALAGMWTHIFSFESELVDQADAKGLLFFSMECRGTHLTCAGDDGCGNTFDYMAFDEHCDHLKERTSVRHIVNPTFRGGALIIPPVKPGWQEAYATTYQEALRDEAAKFAEQTEEAYLSVRDNSDITPSAWEHLMAAIISSAE